MNLTSLKAKRYPGRGFIAARLTIAMVVVYFLTGRRPSSKARMLKRDGDIVKTVVTNKKLLEEGDKRLLLYDAMHLVGKGLVVSNGRQTDRITEVLCSEGGSNSPEWFLRAALNEQVIIDGVDVSTYEPDSNETPRISAIVRDGMVGLHIVRCGAGGAPVRNFYMPALAEGEGVMLTTYEDGSTDDGTETGKLVSFQGGPIYVPIDPGIGHDVPVDFLVDEVWEALDPDLRVSVVAAFIPNATKEPIRIYEKNLHDGARTKAS